jgi:hypothetical protein
VEFRSSGVQEFRSSGVQEFRSSGVQEFRLGRITELQAKTAVSLRGMENTKTQVFAGVWHRTS